MKGTFLFGLLICQALGSSAQTKPTNSIFYDIFDRPVKILENDGRKTLYLFGNNLNIPLRSILCYSQVLFNTYHNKGLNIVGVLCDTPKNIIDFVERGKITFPVIANCDKRIKDMLNLSTDCGGYIILNEKGKTIYSSKASYEKETLRQIVENEITGTINYHFKPMENRLFRLNTIVSNIELNGFADREHIPLSRFKEKYLVISFFSSFCSACKSGGRIKSLEAFLQKRKFPDDECKVIIAFVEPVEKNDIGPLIREKVGPLFFCRGGDVFSDDEKYITNDRYKTDPLTLVLDKERKVIFLEKPGDTEETVIQSINEKIKVGK